MSEMQHSCAADASTPARPGSVAASSRPATSSLLRRLAEAVEGVSGPVWFVASFAPIQGKHQVSVPYPSEEEAKQNVPNPADYGVFGPYEGTSSIFAAKPLTKWEVHLSDGSSQQISAAPFDAFFWSESALRKFALPYYANLNGPEYAIRVRDEFREPRTLVMAHDILTEHRAISINYAGKFNVV